MLTEQYSQVLPGFEDSHVGLRQVMCECGCGEVFFQAKIGRVRKYMNDAHKRKAYREQKVRSEDSVSLESSQLRERLENLRSAMQEVERILSKAQDGSYNGTMEISVFACDVLSVIPMTY